MGKNVYKELFHEVKNRINRRQKPIAPPVRRPSMLRENTLPETLKTVKLPAMTKTTR